MTIEQMMRVVAEQGVAVTLTALPAQPGAYGLPERRVAFKAEATVCGAFGAVTASAKAVSDTPEGAISEVYEAFRQAPAVFKTATALPT